MNRIYRCIGVLAALGGTLLTLAVAAPTALATIPDRAAGPGPGHGLQFMPSSPVACPAGRSP
jgi:hypothetical protein